MSDELVIIGPSGELGIAIPLYRIYPTASDDHLGKREGYSLFLTHEKPIAYILDAGEPGTLPFVNAEIVEARCEFLGKL